MRRVGQLDCQFGNGFQDETVHHIGAALLQGLRRPSEANQLFVDHMMLALTAHVAQAYGVLGNAERVSSGLAPRQVKRACEKLEADLGGKFTLREIAAELGLSPAIFLERFGDPSDCPTSVAPSPTRQRGQAVDDCSWPISFRDRDISRVCQSKPLYARVLELGSRQPERVASRSTGQPEKRDVS